MPGVEISPHCANFGDMSPRPLWYIALWGCICLPVSLQGQHFRYAWQDSFLTARQLSLYLPGIKPASPRIMDNPWFPFHAGGQAEDYAIWIRLDTFGQERYPLPQVEMPRFMAHLGVNEEQQLGTVHSWQQPLFPGIQFAAMATFPCKEGIYEPGTHARLIYLQWPGFRLILLTLFTSFQAPLPEPETLLQVLD